MPNLASYFAHAGWPAEEIEPDAWRSTFADEAGATYDLYVLAGEDWMHLAVSPLLRRGGEHGREQLYAALLRLNQDLRLARLALDADGDINLLADLPAAHAGAGLFAETLELLAYYADQLAPELRRLSSDPPSMDKSAFEE
jgi:hypothetical protein